MEALKGEVAKDAFRIDDVFILINAIKDLHVRQRAGGNPPTLSDLQNAFSQYTPELETALKRTDAFFKDVRRKGDVGALYKTVGEVYLLGGEKKLAEAALTTAIQLLQEVQNFDTTELVDSCHQLLMFAQQSLSTPNGDAEDVTEEDEDYDNDF